MHRLGGSRQHRRTQPVDLCTHLRDLVAGRFDQSTLGRLGYRLQQDEVAQALEEIDGEPSRIMPGIDDVLDGAEQGRTIAGGQRVDRIVDERDVGDAEQRHRLVVADSARTSTGKQLIEDRERVARRPPTGSDDQWEHLGFHGDALARADPFE